MKDVNSHCERSLEWLNSKKKRYRGGAMCQKSITPYVLRAHDQVMYLETGMKNKKQKTLPSIKSKFFFRLTLNEVLKDRSRSLTLREATEMSSSFDRVDSRYSFSLHPLPSCRHSLCNDVLTTWRPTV